MTQPDIKQDLIGQREGMLLALDLLDIHRQSLIKSIKLIDEKLKEME